MARILLSAYACEPGRGSEPGVGWSWATELAGMGHEVTVITRSANRTTIEPCSTPGLRFVYYDLPRWTQRWRKYPGGKAVYYLLWQYLAARYIRQLFPTLPFDGVQHVTYVSARYPSFMGSLGIPFWFGPVSGGEAVPPRLREGFSQSQRWRETLRDISNFLVPLDPLMRRTFRQAEVLLVTRDTLALVPQRWRHKAVIRLAVGLSDQPLIRPNPRPKPSAGGLHLLYVGRLLDWKGAGLALRAVSYAKQSYPEIHFTLVGEGPSKPTLLALARELELGRNVHWVGWLSQRDLAEHYHAADILLYPSLRDSGGMVVLEALAHGVPVVCTDLGGPGIIVNSTCGRAVATSDRSPDQLASDLAKALLELATLPNMLSSLSFGAIVRAQEFKFQSLVKSLYPSLSATQQARQA